MEQYEAPSSEPANNHASCQSTGSQLRSAALCSPGKCDHPEGQTSMRLSM